MKSGKWILNGVLIVMLGALAVLNVLPKSVAMPTSLMMALYVAAMVLVALFLLLFWNERPADERELGNQYAASRVAYVIGTAFLIASLVVQGFRHNVDSAIPLALLVMVATKVLLQASANTR
jgi:cobalamin synthase